MAIGTSGRITAPAARASARRYAEEARRLTERLTVLRDRQTICEVAGELIEHVVSKGGVRVHLHDDDEGVPVRLGEVYDQAGAVVHDFRGQVQLDRREGATIPGVGHSDIYVPSFLEYAERSAL